MKSACYLWVLVTTLVLVVSKAEDCVKRYEDGSERTFTCDKCCGEVYTKHCCLAPVTPTEEGTGLSYVYIVIIVFAILIVAAVVFCIVIACIMYRNRTSDKATINHTSRQPPTIVLHPASIEENQGYPPGYDNPPGYTASSDYTTTVLHGTTGHDITPGGATTSAYHITPLQGTMGYVPPPGDEVTAPVYSTAAELDNTGEVYIETDLVDDNDDTQSGYNTAILHGTTPKDGTTGYVETEIVEATATM